MLDYNLSTAASNVNNVIPFEARGPILGFNIPEAVLLDNTGHSLYHSLQLNLLKRLSRGLQFNLSYTYSRSKDTSGGAIPMCGVPHHAADTYVARLVRKGYRVAICEQMEDPKKAKGVVRREVVRVVSPGTLTDANYLDAREPAFLTAISPAGGDARYGVALLDLSTGEFTTAEYSGPDARQALLDEIAVLRPLEVVAPAGFSEPAAMVETLRLPAVVTTVDAILPVDQFKTFVTSASRFPDDAVVLGVTGHVDDESPLWVTLDTSSGRIRHIGGSNGTHVTAGLYWLPAKRPAAPATDFARLRDYLGALVAGDQPVYGIVLPCVFDIDRARDVAAAEGAVFDLQREKSEP